MTHFDYNPKETTESELSELTKKLLDTPSFNFGDVVRVKGLEHSPLMSIISLSLNDYNIIYGKLTRKYLQATCTYFNKSSQTFTNINFSLSCLEKIS